MVWKEELAIMGGRAKKAAGILATAPTSRKNEALRKMADNLRQNKSTIVRANAEDLEHGRSAGLSEALLDRLALTDARIESMAKGLEDIADFRDPIGAVCDMWTTQSELRIRRVRVPLGVVGIIYEARPNVTADAAGLCLKSGNAAILRGGKEARKSNAAIADILREAIRESGLPQDVLQMLGHTEREAQIALMQLQDIDVLIPRGGVNLKKSVQEHARVPYIMTGMGNCHIFIDESADPAKAEAIAINAKCQRPGVCNAMETLLVHRHIASALLPGLLFKLAALDVEIRGDEAVRALFPQATEATEEDWATEYCGLILAVRVVRDIDEAMEHIRRYSTQHSEAIVTESYANARTFQNCVDASAVYVNASTRFTDGSEFGFGAEIGISTQKLHARGPMGLEQLTSTKYVIDGTGQIRE